MTQHLAGLGQPAFQSERVRTSFPFMRGTGSLTSSRSWFAPLLAVTAVSAACGTATATRQPAPAGTAPAAIVEPARSATPGVQPATSASNGTEADVRFMQRMMGHHGQALTMTKLVPARSRNERLRLLAERIDLTQRDEIAMMRRWLEDRRQEVPGPDQQHAHHAMAGHEASMPGMLSAEELAALEKASGPAFDRLFLEDMIRHHEGALVMVKELLSTRGGGQEPELFRFVADVDADQRAEIGRMRTLLATLPSR